MQNAVIRRGDEFGDFAKRLAVTKVCDTLEAKLHG